MVESDHDYGAEGHRTRTNLKCPKCGLEGRMGQQSLPGTDGLWIDAAGAREPDVLCGRCGYRAQRARFGRQYHRYYSDRQKRREQPTRVEVYRQKAEAAEAQRGRQNRTGRLTR